MGDPNDVRSGRLGGKDELLLGKRRDLTVKAVSIRKWACLFAPVVAAALVGVWTSGHLRSAEPTRNVETVAPVGATSYARVDTDEPFAAVVQRMQAQKEQILSRHRQLLEERYDLSNRPLREPLCHAVNRFRRAHG